MSALDLDRIQGPVLVVAPHPDDESIGCGGLIARLRQRGVAVGVVIMTDGSGSHPCSRSYPPCRLSALREAEAREALTILNADLQAVSFWRLADRYVPSDGPDFERAVARAYGQIETLAPTLLVIPGRTDVHGDHRATNAIWARAVGMLAPPPRVLDYLVWPGPERPDGKAVTLDVAEVSALKRRAVAAHRSQHGLVIDDDPTGFILPAELRARAELPVEAYFEAPR